MGKVDGKVAVITGAGSGIGAATATLLAAEGAAVCCADINEENAARTAAAIKASGGSAISMRVDIADPEANTQMAEAATTTFGALDIAHLNAGTGNGANILEMTVEGWDRTMAVNLRGTMLGIQACARKMLESGGSIVLTSSTAGLVGVRDVSDYSTSKHGVIGLGKTAALDLASHNIRVNVVCPGITDTPIFGPIHQTEQLQKLGRATVPLGRPGTAEEIARLVLFLASDDSSFATGAVFTADGGSTAGGAATRLFRAMDESR
ncbi:SDR family oxidoreductase [Nocardia sp. NPDC051990]|uniref:SDR family NAD(P)-dependent oxidoreductase n=1 Tax=Nocardia sp. NPDC051990 TaxID=3155285 RepID=UPI0034406934